MNARYSPIWFEPATPGGKKENKMANCITTHGTGCRAHHVHTCTHSHTLAHTHTYTHTQTLSLRSSGEIKSKADVRVKPGLRQRGGSAKHEKAGACQTRTHLPMDCSQYRPAASVDLQLVRTCSQYWSVVEPRPELNGNGTLSTFRSFLRSQHTVISKTGWKAKC